MLWNDLERLDRSNLSTAVTRQQLSGPAFGAVPLRLDERQLGNAVKRRSRWLLE